MRHPLIIAGIGVLILANVIGISFIVSASEPIHIEVIKTNNSENVIPGELLLYHIVLNNPEDFSVDNVTITENLPEFLIPQDATPQAMINGQTVRWVDQTIPAEGMTFLLRAKVADSTPEGYIIKNHVSVEGPGVHQATTEDITHVVFPSPQISDEVVSVDTTAATGPGIGVVGLFVIATIAAGTGTFLLRKSI